MLKVQSDLQSFVETREQIDNIYSSIEELIKVKRREQIGNINSSIEEFIKEEEDTQNCYKDGQRIVTNMHIKDYNSEIRDLLKNNNDFKDLYKDNCVLHGNEAIMSTKISFLTYFWMESNEMIEMWSELKRKEEAHLLQFFRRLKEHLKSDNNWIKNYSQSI